jgi:cytosine/adenosine deaminase-related metal-dependent hydrolase
MTIITADWLIANPQTKPLRSCGIRIQDTKVVEIGKNEELKAKYPKEEHIDGKGKIMLPGFVNAHTHMYGVLAHGIPLSNPPEDFWAFLKDYWWPKVEDSLDKEMITAATKWACAEMLQSGTTTFYDILEAPNTLPGGLYAQREEVMSAGIRGILSFEATERSGMRIGQLGIEENMSFHRETQKDELISEMMCLHTTFTCSEEFISEAFSIADQNNLGLHVHCNEGIYEGLWCEENFGKRPLEIYESLGVANSNFIASQCVHLSEKEIAIIKNTGIKVTHMPLANCEVGGGIAPIPELIDAGVTVGLGSDGYINDFYEVMRGAFLIHKARLQDPGVMPASTVLEMATSSGAMALGLKQVGKLEPGYSADLQLIDGQFPTPLTSENIFEQIILWRNAKHVSDVMVAGTWKVSGNELLSIDLDQARDALHKQARRLWAV